MDADLESAVLASHLRELPADVIDDLMAGAVRLKIPAPSVIHRARVRAHRSWSWSSPGSVRVFVTAPDGRTMTVRYCRPGALLGVMSLFIPGFALPAAVQALVDAEVLALSPGVARRAAAQDIRVTQAFLREQSERAISFLYEVPGSAFATVRQRVARHLLDIASEARRNWSSRSASNSWRRRSGRSARSSSECSVSCAPRAWCTPNGTSIVIVDPARLIAEQDWNSSP